MECLFFSSVSRPIELTPAGGSPTLKGTFRGKDIMGRIVQVIVAAIIVVSALITLANSRHLRGK